MRKSLEGVRICYVATTEAALMSFMGPIIRRLAGDNEVHVVTPPSASGGAAMGGAHRHIVDFARRPAPARDVICFAKLWWLFVRGDFNIVHTIMPKTGLLGMLAAWLAAVPVRIHTFTGQTWANDEGLRRWIFIQLDRLTARLATHILVDSQSQLEFLRSCRICPGAKGQVLGEGSVCGVDVQRFAPSAEVRGEVRAACGIAADDIVVLFVGRLCVDKGVLDLCAVFERLYQRYRHVRLLVAGPQDGLSVTDLQSVCGKARKNLHYVGSTNVVERYMAAADMFCLPSYREGFGQVVIEAAACQLPVVASDIYGLRDSVVDNVTGLLFPIRDQDRMLVLLDQLAKDRSLRDRLGANGRERVMRDFQESGLTFALVEFYAVALAH